MFGINLNDFDDGTGQLFVNVAGVGKVQKNFIGNKQYFKMVNFVSLLIL